MNDEEQPQPRRVHEAQPRTLKFDIAVGSVQYSQHLRNTGHIELAR
jgi:hypothetical protein